MASGRRHVILQASRPIRSNPAVDSDRVKALVVDAGSTDSGGSQSRLKGQRKGDKGVTGDPFGKSRKISRSPVKEEEPTNQSRQCMEDRKPNSGEGSKQEQPTRQTSAGTNKAEEEVGQGVEQARSFII